MDTQAWLQRAEKAIEEVKVEQTFVVKDLFDGVEWSNLSKGDRQRFGKVFKNEVLEGTIPNLRYIGKEGNNSAKYEKIKA